MRNAASLTLAHGTVAATAGAQGGGARGGAVRRGEYQLTGRLHAVAQYDRQRTEGDELEVAPSSLLRHQGVAAGLDFRVTPTFVVKSAAHRIAGNRLAMPEEDDLAGAIATGTVPMRTTALFVGAAFSW